MESTRSLLSTVTMATNASTVAGTTEEAVYKVNQTIDKFKKEIEQLQEQMDFVTNLCKMLLQGNGSSCNKKPLADCYRRIEKLNAKKSNNVLVVNGLLALHEYLESGFSMPGEVDDSISDVVHYSGNKIKIEEDLSDSEAVAKLKDLVSDRDEEVERFM